jgi:hypothetical protein
MIYFLDFLKAWRNGTLDKDATWRAYHIPEAVKPPHVQAALTQLSLIYAGELALGKFMSMYQIEDPDDAREILAQWYLWHRKANGYATPPVKRKRQRRTA